MATPEGQSGETESVVAEVAPGPVWHNIEKRAQGVIADITAIVSLAEAGVDLGDVTQPQIDRLLALSEIIAQLGETMLDGVQGVNTRYAGMQSQTVLTEAYRGIIDEPAEAASARDEGLGLEVAAPQHAGEEHTTGVKEPVSAREFSVDPGYVAVPASQLLDYGPPAPVVEIPQPKQDFPTDPGYTATPSVELLEHGPPAPEVSTQPDADQTVTLELKPEVVGTILDTIEARHTKAIAAKFLQNPNTVLTTADFRECITGVSDASIQPAISLALRDLRAETVLASYITREKVGKSHEYVLVVSDDFLHEFGVETRPDNDQELEGEEDATGPGEPDIELESADAAQEPEATEVTKVEVDDLSLLRIMHSITGKHAKSVAYELFKHPGEPYTVQNLTAYIDDVKDGSLSASVKFALKELMDHPVVGQYLFRDDSAKTYEYWLVLPDDFLESVSDLVEQGVLSNKEGLGLLLEELPSRAQSVLIYLLKHPNQDVPPAALHVLMDASNGDSASSALAKALRAINRYPEFSSLITYQGETKDRTYRLDLPDDFPVEQVLSDSWGDLNESSGTEALSPSEQMLGTLADKLLGLKAVPQRVYSKLLDTPGKWVAVEILYAMVLGKNLGENKRLLADAMDEIEADEFLNDLLQFRPIDGVPMYRVVLPDGVSLKEDDGQADANAENPAEGGEPETALESADQYIGMSFELSNWGLEITHQGDSDTLSVNGEAVETITPLDVDVLKLLIAYGDRIWLSELQELVKEYGRTDFSYSELNASLHRLENALGVDPKDQARHLNVSRSRNPTTRQDELSIKLKKAVDPSVLPPEVLKPRTA